VMNKKLDFEISNENEFLRFVSFPCDCVRPAGGSVASFNLVFIFDSNHINDQTAELYFEAIATISRAIVSEESRSAYLTNEINLINSNNDSNLITIISKIFNGLKSPDRAVSLYVNDCVLTHINTIDLGEAPPPPPGHMALLLTTDPNDLQTQLPVDSASNVRRVIDAADPHKSIKDHMIELGLPVSTIQRVSQHLVYWKKARIVHPLNKRSVLCLNPDGPFRGVRVDGEEEFIQKHFNSNLNLFYEFIFNFSKGFELSQIKEKFENLRFNDIVHHLLSRGYLSQSLPFYRYIPPVRPLNRPPLLDIRRPKFQQSLPNEIRSQFSPSEFELIFEKLNQDPVGSELMVKLISNYVKNHEDLLTARIELNEIYRCTNEDFHRYTEKLSGYLDGLLVLYNCDL
jgi:hypothetical protein